MPKSKVQVVRVAKRLEQPLWVRNAVKRALVISWCWSHNWLPNRHGFFLSSNVLRRLNLKSEDTLVYEERRLLTREEKANDPLRNSKWVSVKAASYRDVEIGTDNILFPSDKVEEQKAEPVANESVGSDADKKVKE